MEHEQTTLNLDDHLERCRLCLNSISESEIFYIISETIKHKFEELTSLELEIDNQKFSSLICVSCHRNLTKFKALRDELVLKQSQLYEVVYGKDDDKNEEEIEMLEDEETTYLSGSEARSEAEEESCYQEELIRAESEFEDTEMTVEFIVDEDLEDSLIIQDGEINLTTFH